MERHQGPEGGHEGTELKSLRRSQEVMVAIL